MSQEMPPTVRPMDFETFARLWSHPVADRARNWQPDLATYRDAYLHLMGVSGPRGTRRPNFARLAVPPYMQPLLVALFLDGHQLFAQPSPSGERILLTIWRPPHPGEEEERQAETPDEPDDPAPA